MERPFIFLYVTLFLCLAASLLFLLNGCRGRKTKAVAKELPPGPPALLFVAKLLALRKSVLHIGPLLRELHARHGPIVSVNLFRTILFVADRRLAHRILVQGGAVFDDRPPLVEPFGLFLPRTILTSPYGSYWRLIRRNLAGEALHAARLELFAPARRRALEKLVRALGGDGSRAVTMRPLFQRATLELLVCMCLGARLGPEALDELLALQLRIFGCIGSWSVFSIFPTLTKKLFRRRWAGHVAMRKRQEAIFLPLIHARRSQHDPPFYSDSLLALRVADEGDRRLTDVEVVSLCSEFVVAGLDTTVAILEWIMAELVNRPDVQAKVYEEVRGKPELGPGDLRATPYLKAVVLEGLRLHPPVPFLNTHSVRSEAEVGGYAVREGTEVYFRVAGFGLDETVWAAAREFRPERFLDGGVDITGSTEIKMLPFGAGRRMCAGYTLAMLHLEYFVGSLVRDLEWLPAAHGVCVDMTEEPDSVTVMKHPLRARNISRTP